MGPGRTARKKMANGSFSETSSGVEGLNRPLPQWLRMSAVAAASALAGGLAAAWFYRKTLARLQQAEIDAQNSNFRISAPAADEDFDL